MGNKKVSPNQRSLFELMQDSAIVPKNKVDAVHRDPLPLIVASEWNFPLQYHVIGDTHYFAVIDWIAGLATTDNISASKIWGKMQNETSTSSRTLNYLATDGKTYQRDYTDDETLYKIAGYMRATKKRPALQAIKDYLAKAGVIVDAVHRDPLKAKAFIKATEKHHGLREESIQQRKSFTFIVTQKHIQHNPQIGLLTNAIYSRLFRVGTEYTAKREIVAILGLSNTQAKSMRDHLKPLALSAVKMAEEAAMIKIDNSSALLSDDEMMAIVKHCARIVAVSAHELADYAGVDLLTSLPVLKNIN